MLSVNRDGLYTIALRRPIIAIFLSQLPRYIGYSQYSIRPPHQEFHPASCSPPVPTTNSPNPQALAPLAPNISTRIKAHTAPPPFSFLFSFFFFFSGKDALSTPSCVGEWPCY